VPLPNVEFDGDTSTREVAVYRPTNKYIYWKVAGGTTWNAINVNAAAVRDRVVHLHGLYDSDNKTDIVLYMPETNVWYMLLSTNGWSMSQAVTRTIDEALVANAIAASSSSNPPAERHGGVVLPAENNGRRALRIWDAYTGHWYTFYNPVTSSSVTTCQWGSPRDIPLGGPIDRNSDGRTDLVVARPDGNANGPAVFILAGSPCGTPSALYPTGLTEKARVWAVADMNGDGKGDFLFLDPDTYAWNPWYSSGTTWVSGGTFYLGDIGAVPL
jgi:hypothetical protein